MCAYIHIYYIDKLERKNPNYCKIIFEILIGVIFQIAIRA